MLHAHGRSSTSSFLLCSLFCDALDLPQGAYLDFPRPREWETVAGQYRTLFACVRHPTAGCPPSTPKSKTLHRTSRPTISSRPRRRMRRATNEVDPRGPKRVESGLCASFLLNSDAATPERTDRMLENDHLHTGPTEEGSAARSAAERRHAAGSRGASPCAYCRRALEESTGDSAVDSLWALIPCPHGEQVHARYMLDRAKRVASGHADPQPRVAYRSEWPARNRPLHFAELAGDLPRPRPGGRWPAIA